MTNVNLRDSFCKYYQSAVYQNIRNEAWGFNSINIASLLRMEQLNEFCEWLSLKPEMTLLDACCGIGETTKYLAEKMQCSAYGIDISIDAINCANCLTNQSSSDLTFTITDIKNGLPFQNSYFDAITCIESIIYFSHAERLAILKEWNRVLKPGAKLIYTDPCVISGILSDQELATRAAFGGYFFSPVGTQENLVKECGFKLIKSEDITKNNCETVSKRWWEARKRNMIALHALESIDEFDCIHQYIEMCSQLYNSDEGPRKLSQYAFYLIKNESVI